MNNAFYNQCTEFRWLFNRERLVLAAIQNTLALEELMETDTSGLTSLEVLQRRRMYGLNELHLPFSRKKNGISTMKGKELSELVRKMNGQRITALRRDMESPVELESGRLVPGDLVFLIKGDIVPADIRIIDAHGFSVSQLPFTGEMTPIVKTSDNSEKSCSTSSVTELSNITLAGSEVLDGMAKGIVISTGAATYFGEIIYGY